MNTTNTTVPTESLYDRIGGESAVDAALEIFYKKILEDPILQPFFQNSNIPNLVQKQKSFLTFAFGGPSDYTYWQRGLRNAHKSSVENGMGNLHFDLVMKYLEDTLKELSIPQNLIDEVLLVTEGTRKHVLNQ